MIIASPRKALSNKVYDSGETTPDAPKKQQSSDTRMHHLLENIKKKTESYDSKQTKADPYKSKANG